MAFADTLGSKKLKKKKKKKKTIIAAPIDEPDDEGDDNTQTDAPNDVSSAFANELEDSAVPPVTGVSVQRQHSGEMDTLSRSEDGGSASMSLGPSGSISLSSSYMSDRLAFAPRAPVSSPVQIPPSTGLLVQTSVTSRS